MIYLELFLTFLMIGAITFGGGYAMLPIIQKEVAAKGWVDAASLVDFVAVSESTPGPFAINMATYVGSEVGGVFGAVCATLGVVVPSFVVILIVAKCYDAFRQSKVVKGCMSGLKPAVVGLSCGGTDCRCGDFRRPDGILPGWIQLWRFYAVEVLSGCSDFCGDVGAGF